MTALLIVEILTTVVLAITLVGVLLLIRERRRARTAARTGSSPNGAVSCSLEGAPLQRVSVARGLLQFVQTDS